MDSTTLVNESQHLVHLLDKAGYAPRGAMLVNNPDSNSWRLWIVPSPDLANKKDFYARIASLFVDNRTDFSSLDAADIDLRLSTYPPILELGKLFHINGIGSIHMNGNMLNGYYLPDCIILRMML